jgi:hypothetical protein
MDQYASVVRLQIHLFALGGSKLVVRGWIVVYLSGVRVLAKGNLSDKRAGVVGINASLGDSKPEGTALAAQTVLTLSKTHSEPPHPTGKNSSFRTLKPRIPIRIPGTQLLKAVKDADAPRPDISQLHAYNFVHCITDVETPNGS